MASFPRPRGERVSARLAVVLAAFTVVALYALLGIHDVVPLGTLNHVAGYRYGCALPEGLPRGDFIDASGNFIQCSPMVLLENGKAIGTPHGIHKEIEEQGGGRYSHWGTALNFSTPDNSDPGLNGRSYALQTPWVPVRAWLPAAWGALAAALLWLGFGGNAGRRVLSSACSRRTAARLGLAGAASLVALLAAEVALRLANDRPVVAASALARNASIVPVIGEVLPPGSTYVYDGQPGNPAEFHTEERVNSFGMLDVEHATDKAPGCFRVLVLGDSFVQADQVAMEDKWPRMLERLLQSRTGHPVEVVALARDGAGVANQYGYWRGLGRFLQADLVLLMMTPRNDFSDDSLELQSINRNFDSDHPPRFWFRGPAENFAEVLPDVDAAAFRSVLPPTTLQSAYSWLAARSVLVAVLGQRLGRDADIARLLTRHGATQPRSDEERRVLEVPIAYWEWCYADASTWPAWQRDGLEVTRHALFRLKQEIEVERGVPFLVCLDTIKQELAAWTARTQSGIELRYDRPQLLASGVLDELGIRALALSETFRARGGLPSRAHWVTDGHWNETGHRWAADDVVRWLDGLGVLPAPAGHDLPVFAAGTAIPCGEAIPCDAVPESGAAVLPDRPRLDPAPASAMHGACVLPQPGVYRLRSASGPRVVLALDDSPLVSAEVAFSFAAGASNGGSSDNATFTASALDFTRGLFHRDQPAALACGPTTQVMGLVLDEAGLQHRLVQWVGESEDYLAHQSVEVLLPGHGWTLYDPHMGLAFKPGCSALEVFELARAGAPLAPEVGVLVAKASWEAEPLEVYARYDTALGYFHAGVLEMLIGDAELLAQHPPGTWTTAEVRFMEREAIVDSWYAGDDVREAPAGAGSRGDTSPDDARLAPESLGAGADPCVFTLLPAQMQHAGGLAWRVELPDVFLASASDVEHPLASRAVLTEDGRVVGPSNALHADIRAEGHGAFSHWGTGLYLSSSDGTDPTSNGRSYVLQLPAAADAVKSVNSADSAK